MSLVVCCVRNIPIGTLCIECLDADRKELHEIELREAQSSLPVLSLASAPLACIDYYLFWARAFRCEELVRLQEGLGQRQFRSVLTAVCQIRDGWFWFDLAENLPAGSLAERIRGEAAQELARTKGKLGR